MPKRNILKVLSVVFVAVIILTFFLPGKATGWSAVIGNRTHADIDDAAYAIVSHDPAFKNVKFPLPDSIKNNDWVNPVDSGSTGPDFVGRSNASDHFYNPRLEAFQGKAGGAVDAVTLQFTNLVNGYSSGKPNDAAKAASWAAHYIADISMPYHTQGEYRTEILKIYDDAMKKKATTVPLPSYITGPLNLSTSIGNHPNDFKKEIEAFKAATANHTDTEDWFDPWYWDGRVNAMIFSSHVVFEGETFAMPGSLTSIILDWNLSGGVKTYSRSWTNPTPSFDNVVTTQAAKIREFARGQSLEAQRAVDGVDGLVSVATPYLVSSIEGAATVWRASFSALSPSIAFNVPDKKQPQKLKLTGTVMNTAGETVKSAQYRLTVTGGTLKSGKQSGVTDDIGGGYGRTLEWEVEASNLGYCTAKLEIIGKYKDTPDLQYAVTQVTAPGIVPVSVTNTSARRSHSIVFCLDNSGSMSGQPIQDAMNAGVQAVTSAVGSELEMALYFFGQSGCDAPQRMVDFTVDRDRIKTAMRTASARGNTPLATMIATAGDYIHKSAQGSEATIILLTDGMETCGGDPVAAARALNPGLKLKTSWFTKPVYAASNTPIKLQVVGLNIKSAADETKLKEISQAGNGNYYPAANVQQLTQSLNQAIKEGTGSGFKFQTWWFIAAGALLLLIIIISLARRGKRTPAPATAPAGVSTSAPPQAQQPVTTTPPATLFCPNCGARVQPSAVFCTGCGKPLVPQGPSFCPGCGAPVTTGNAFCGKCGSSLIMNMTSQAQAAPQSPAPAAIPKPAKKKVSGLWWFLAIFLLLPGGLIAWAVVKKEHPGNARAMLSVSTLLSALVLYNIVNNIIH